MLFEAKLPANNREEMHIASEHYDEPEALAVTSAEVVIALHGRQDEGTPRGHGCDALNRAGFPVLFDPPKFKGTHPDNIRNRGLTKAGVELEIPLSLRKEFERNPARERAFVSCLRAAIASYQVQKS